MHTSRSRRLQGPFASRTTSAVYGITAGATVKTTITNAKHEFVPSTTDFLSINSSRALAYHWSGQLPALAPTIYNFHPLPQPTGSHTQQSRHATRKRLHTDLVMPRQTRYSPRSNRPPSTKQPQHRRPTTILRPIFPKVLHENPFRPSRLNTATHRLLRNSPKRPTMRPLEPQTSGPETQSPDHGQQDRALSK